MRKLFTFLFTMVVAILANAQIVPTTTVGEAYKSVAELDGISFAIVNTADGKALHGSNNQNLAYSEYSAAFSSGNTGYMWKLVSVPSDADEAIQGCYYLQLITPKGENYNCWGMGGYLNSQPATGGCSFILGLNNQHGQDGANLAVYDIQYVEDLGFVLKNIGTGMYQGYNNLPANSADPVYWTFAPVESSYVPALESLLAEGEAMKATVTRADAVAAYEAAITGIDPATTTDALADAKKVDAAIIELAKAIPAVAGADFTRAIVNPSFEAGSIEGWTESYGGNSANNGNFGAAAGSYFVERWQDKANGGLSDGSIMQTITGLPNGTYKLTAPMQNLEQNNSDAAGKGYLLVANDDSTEVAVSGETVEVTTEVTDGTLTIGAVLKGCTGNWVCVDNFQLTLVEPAPVFYSISVAEIVNGTVTADPEEAIEGAEVVLAVTPAEGYELESLSVVAGETAIEVSESYVFVMPAADVTVSATFAAIEEEPAVDANLIEIAQDQGKDLDTFPRAELVEGEEYNTYTVNADLTVAFKMMNVDVKDCDYVVIKFAEPVAAGWKVAFWGGQETADVPEGATEYKYVFADDANCAVQDDILPQICLMNLWGASFPLVAKVEGVYKHSTVATEPEPEPTEKTYTIDVERYPGMGYDPTTATADLAEALSFLGVEAATAEMLSIVNPDGTEVSDYATYDGWFAADGTAKTWFDLNPADARAAGVCVKFFQVLEGDQFEICDMNGADVVGTTYTVKYALKANDKTAIYTINVKFVEKPFIYLADYTAKAETTVLKIAAQDAEGNWAAESATEAINVADITALVGENYVVYGVGAKDGDKETLTNTYSCVPHPGFWCLADGTADIWDNSTFGVSFYADEGVFKTWTKAAVTEDLSTTFYFVNEEAKEYVAYKVVLCAPEVVDEWFAEGNFKVNDYVNGEKMAIADARYEVDPTDESNSCIVVTSNDEPAHDYDAQLFISTTDPLNVGDVITLTMKVRADREQSAASQAHSTPGNYIHWACVGNINFTTEWTESTLTATVTADMSKEDQKMQTITFNLSDMTNKTANNFYFDDIKLEVAVPDAIEGVEAATAANGKYMENGKLVIIKNGKKFNAAGQAIK